MAKNKNADSGNNALDNLNDSLTGLGAKVQKNQKIIFIVAGSLGVIVLGVLVYIFAFRGPRIQAGNQAIGQADIELAMGNDSTALAMYEKVADEHGYDAGNRAALMSAILLYREHKYQEALNYLKKFSDNEKIVGPAAFSLEGDCYVNLNQLPQAVEAYNKAIKKSDKNPYYTPFFMLKKARVYHEMKNYQEEANVYAEIQKEYPLYGSRNGIDIEKYLDRANYLAGK